MQESMFLTAVTLIIAVPRAKTHDFNPAAAA
jgi:hypothetical protein